MTHYTYPKNSRKNIQVILIEIEPSFRQLSQSMTTDYRTITCQFMAYMKKVFVDLMNINLY